MASLQNLLAGGIARVSLTSSRHARTTLVATLLATVVFGYGVTLITTDVDVADVLPRGNPNTDAAHKLTRDFRSTFTQQATLNVHIDEGTDFQNWETDNAKLQYRYLGLPFPDATEPGQPAGPGTVEANRYNITDEVYVRAIEELVRFIQDRTDFDRSINIAGLYSLINWTIAGGEDADDSAYSLPGYEEPADAIRYQTVDQGVKAAILDTVDAISSPSWHTAATLFSPLADNERHTRALGEEIMAARDEYVRAVEAGETEFTVFGPDNPPLFVVDLPVANAHSSQLVREDTMLLLPIIGAFILLCLWIAFRNVRAIAISFAALGVSIVWTYGTMGYMGIALNTLNMTVVPLIMGVGIDYAIHMISEFSEHKAHGLTNDDAFRASGRRAGVAMLIATLTTVGGLLVMVFSPSLLIAQVGMLSAIAMGAIYILAITFIPAALTLVGGSEGMGSSFSPSKAMPALARGVSKVRFVMLFVVIAMTSLAYVSSTHLGKEAFGDPGKNYPADDPVRQEHEQALTYFYEEDANVKANILTFEGEGVLTPESIEYMRTIEANLKTKDRVISDTLRTLPFFIETWLTVKDGAPGAGQVVVLERLLGLGAPPVLTEEAQDFPDTPAELEQEVNAMFETPFSQLSSIIINHPQNDMAAMTFSVRAGTYEEAEEVWHQVWDAVEKANVSFGGQAPDGVQVAFVGNTATNYLFIAEELPYLTYMGLAANGVLFVLVVLLMRSIRAIIAIMLLSFITTVWWLGVLPLMGIGLAITLTLPLVFITAIGTDYAVHLIQNIREVGDSRTVFETTGKAVLFSTVTTVGAFVVFSFIQNVAVSRTMVATTVAILLIFLASMLVVPIFYPVRAKGKGTAADGPAPDSDAGDEAGPSGLSAAAALRTRDRRKTT